MTLTEYTLLTFSSLFVIVDPIAVVSAFLAMTPSDPPAAQLCMARLACAVAAGGLTPGFGCQCRAGDMRVPNPPDAPSAL
jgi:small neutral amino acid transporter SnatA (MarC family)